MCLFVIGHNLNPIRFCTGTFWLGLGILCLTPLSTIFQLYRGGQFYCWRKPEYPEKTTDLPQVEFELYNKCIKCYDYL
jgi:hypothetical protein